MAYFPQVVKGQPFVPNIQLENTLRRMVNSSNFTTARNNAKSPTIRIPVYNAGESTIAIGTAVNIVGSPVEIDDPSPCLPFFDENMPWGVVSNSIDAGECCSCVVSGPVQVQINDTGGNYAEPDPNNPELFKTAQNGVPIVTRTQEYAVINLGGGGGGGGYNGPFAASLDKVNDVAYVNVNGGYVQINLSGFDIPPARLFFSSVPSSIYIGFELILDSDKGEYSYNFMHWKQRPTPEIGKAYIVVAYIDAEERITQLQYGDFNGVIWGECAFPSGEYDDI